MSKLRLYVMVATFFVLLITACYLEFPVVTVLILIFVIVLYLCCSDGKVGFLGFGKTASSQISNFSRSLSVLPAVSTRSKGRRRDSNKPALLTGISGFSLNVFAPSNWRYPFLQRRVFAIAKATLDEQGLFCGSQDQWLSDNDVASMKVEISLEQYQREVRLTVQIEVVGRITITRSQASISEAACLWKNTVPRLTNSTDLIYDLEDALISAFNALLRDYFGSTHSGHQGNILPPGR